MSKATIKVIISVVIITLLFAGIKTYQIKQAIKAGTYVPPPEAVTTAMASEADWTTTFQAVGTVASLNGAMLSAQEGGKVTKITFESGSLVEAGQVLVEIDTSVEQANLKGALANQLRTKKSFDRIASLREKNAISQDEFENASAQQDLAVAQTESIKASIERKRIISPVAGRAGIRTVNVGDYVNAGQAIVPVHDLKRVYANFSLPQSMLPKVAPGSTVTVSSDATGDKTFKGTVNAVNSSVSESTRSAAVQAVIDNPDELLRPGMFISTVVSFNEVTKGLVVPITSVNSAPYGDSVFIVENGDNNSKKVRQQFIKVGGKRGDQVQILQGLKAGEEVVTSGLFKIRPGAAVEVHNELAPSASENPTPQDT